MNFGRSKNINMNSVYFSSANPNLLSQFKTVNDPSFIISISGQFENVLCQLDDLQHQSTKEIEVGDQKKLSEAYDQFKKSENHYFTETKNNGEDEITVRYLTENLPPCLKLEISQAGPLEELISTSGESSN